MKRERWPIERIRKGFEKFYEEKGRYPTALEIDAFEFLPTSRTIQREFGGLPALRQTLNLSGPSDFTKGEYSSARAKTVNQRANKVEKSVYDELVSKFGKPFVHREYFFNDDRRTRADFYVYGKNTNFLVDVFYPKDIHNLAGCLNSKIRTYGDLPDRTSDKIIFLMLNEAISDSEVKIHLSKKKRALPTNQRVMTYGEFKTFIDTVSPRSVA